MTAKCEKCGAKENLVAMWGRRKSAERFRCENCKSKVGKGYNFRIYQSKKQQKWTEYANKKNKEIAKKYA